MLREGQHRAHRITSAKRGRPVTGPAYDPSVPPTSEPVTDTLSAYPEQVAIRDRALARDYAGVVDVLLETQERDECAAAAAVDTVGDVDGVEDLLEDRLAQAPDDVLARTMLANRQVRIGWAIRTSARADQVSAQQFTDFHAWLRKAEQHLIAACAIEPEWSVPWLNRLTTARGLQLGVIEARRRYDRLAEHHPHHSSAQSNLLQMLLPKWYGSWDEAFGFARASADAAAPGSRSKALVADVHLEKWLDLKGGDAGRNYLASREVNDELQSAARASVWHPDYGRPYGWINDHSVFAVLHALAGRTAEAAPHFQALGDYLDDWAWGYLGTGAQQTVNKVRLAALSNGGRR